MKRYSRNPLLTRDDLPDVTPVFTDATSVFNPGAARFLGKVCMLLRVQARSRETFLMRAESDDGLRFVVHPEVVEIEGLAETGETIFHVYDPRLTVLDGVLHVVFAADVPDGCRLGIARTEDFSNFELLGLCDHPDTRNGVLFPRKVRGKYLMLERPNQVAHSADPTSGDEIVLSESDDLVTWSPRAAVMCGRPHYWDERIGSGPPPVATREGWLHLYHGVATHFQSSNIYQAGVALLDLDDPSRVVARSRHNILEPRELYETVGQVPNVVFPSGMVVDETDSDGFATPGSAVTIYYGAADTCVAAAHTTIGELLASCRDGEGRPPLPTRPGTRS